MTNMKANLDPVQKLTWDIFREESSPDANDKESVSQIAAIFDKSKLDMIRFIQIPQRASRDEDLRVAEDRPGSTIPASRIVACAGNPLIPAIPQGMMGAAGRRGTCALGPISRTRLRPPLVAMPRGAGAACFPTSADVAPWRRPRRPGPPSVARTRRATPHNRQLKGT